MKFEISRSLLDNTLQSVSKGLSNKPQMPILTGIKIDVRESYILYFENGDYIDLDGYTSIEISEKEILPLLIQFKVILVQMDGRNY